MDTLKQGKEKTTAATTSAKEVRDQFRVVISGEANAELETMTIRASRDFDAGAITKSDLANFVFLNLSKFFSESDVNVLRTIHFDDKKMLGTLLKTDEDLPVELKKAIRAHYGVVDKDKRRTGRQQEPKAGDVELPPLPHSEP